MIAQKRILNSTTLGFFLVSLLKAQPLDLVPQLELAEELEDGLGQQESGFGGEFRGEFKASVLQSALELKASVPLSDHFLAQ